ncbi:hypothetical protein K9L97_00750 [Candidatus Woesearchaeota archaeon]|nr:hypothetical protein [Candidatus Woesearchaeota archaeon]
MSDSKDNIKDKKAIKTNNSSKIKNKLGDTNKVVNIEDANPEDVKPKDVKAKNIKRKSVKNKKKVSLKFVFLLFVLVVFIIIVSFSIFESPVVEYNESVVPINYNNYTFKLRSDGFWETIIDTPSGVRSALFHYNPYDLEDVYFDGNITKDLRTVHKFGGNAFVSVRPEALTSGSFALSGIEVAKILSHVVGFSDGRTKSALTEKLEGVNSTIANCDTANPMRFVVEIGMSNLSGIYYEDYCVRLLGSDVNETLRLADTFAFYVIGVMD